MNSVAQGLNLSAGEHVAISDQEHPGGRSGWDYTARKYGVVIDTVPIPAGENDAGAIVDRFARALTPKTRAMVFSHVLTSTGLRMPVAELSAVARSRGCLAIVDGAQAAGGIEVNVKTLGCHVYLGCGHKWLLGPPGTGYVYLSEETGRAIDPIALQAGRNVYCDSSGVTNIPGVLGLAAAVGYVNAIGVAAVERHNLELRNRLYAALQDVPRLKVVSAPPGPLATPLLTFTIPDAIKSQELTTRLSERHQVVVKTVPVQWMNGNRISTHLFNTPQDVDALVDALRKELA
jgi:selenocysteine lyase/cysteine desulfurase